MAVYRVERNKNYTVMCNWHLQDRNISLKAKGLLSMMLSLPENWSFSIRGLASRCKEGVEAVSTGLKELEKAGYIVRRQIRGDKGRITDTEYVIYERPQDRDPDPENPGPGGSSPAGPDIMVPGNRTRSRKNIVNMVYSRKQETGGENHGTKKQLHARVQGEIGPGGSERRTGTGRDRGSE